MIYRKSIKYFIEGSWREKAFKIKADSEQQAFKILAKRCKALIAAVEDDPGILKAKKEAISEVRRKAGQTGTGKSKVRGDREYYAKLSHRRWNPES